jgi:hypothetical protein
MSEAEQRLLETLRGKDYVILTKDSCHNEACFCSGNISTLRSLADGAVRAVNRTTGERSISPTFK